MVKIILIKSPDEWATTKQACRDELVVYLCFSSHIVYFALLWCIEHCSTKIKFYTYTRSNIARCPRDVKRYNMRAKKAELRWEVNRWSADVICVICAVTTTQTCLRNHGLKKGKVNNFLQLRPLQYNICVRLLTCEHPRRPTAHIVSMTDYWNKILDQKVFFPSPSYTGKTRRPGEIPGHNSPSWLAVSKF